MLSRTLRCSVAMTAVNSTTGDVVEDRLGRVTAIGRMKRSRVILMLGMTESPRARPRSLRDPRRARPALRMSLPGH